LKLYYTFTPQIGYRCIVLDGYDVSTIGASTEEYKEYSEVLLRAKNKVYAEGGSNWFADKDLPACDRKYVPFNGGIGAEQMEWLQKQLCLTVASSEKCIIFCHMPLLDGCCLDNNIHLWNNEEVMALLHQTPRGTVLACIAGHDHDGGYGVDSHGIHHITPPAPIECEDDTDSYGIISIHPTKLTISWTGKVPFLQWPKDIAL
jgi:manganese-dependent ADP-ribose/CDP-alcohol diphosphatase